MRVSDCRVVDLSDGGVTSCGSGVYHSVKEYVDSRGDVREERYREGDFIHIKTTITNNYVGELGQVQSHKISEEVHPAVIPFRWILSRCDAAPDEYSWDLPWNAHDGWEHDLVKVEDHISYHADRGLIHDSRAFVNVDYRPHIILITDKSYAGDSRQSRFDWLRAKGASKQVAAEVVARQDQIYIDQLVKWYTEDVIWWKAFVYFDLLGECYENTLGMIDDEHYAATDACTELALELIHQLTQDGFTVTDIPDPSLERKKAKHRRLQHNLNLFNWHDS